MTCIISIPSYTITNSNGRIVAVNCVTGNIDYSSTDISSVLTSINGAISGGETVFITKGTYTPSAQVVFTKSVRIVGEGKDSVIFNWNTTGIDLFVFQGSNPSTTTITGDVAVRANTVAVTSVGTAVAGDLIFIYDNTIWNPTDYPVWKTGELHEVQSISGSTITLTDSTLNAFTVAQSGSVKIIKPITVTFDGIQIVGVDKTADYRGIQLQYNKNSIIQNGKFQNNGLRAIDIDTSYKTTIKNNVINNCVLAGYGYGVSISNPTAYTIIINNRMTNCRHCVQHGGGGAAGQPRESIVIANTFEDSSLETPSDTVLDAHDITESHYLYHNIIYCRSDIFALNSGAKITEFIGNVVIGGQGVSITGHTPNNYIGIRENIFRNVAAIFNNYSNRQTIDTVDIQNNFIQGGNIVFMYNITNFNVSENRFVQIDSLNDGGATLRLYTCGSGTVSKNIIINSKYGAIQTTATLYSIIDNQIINYATNIAIGQEGISIINSSNGICSGNILSSSNAGSTYGINESGTSDYNRISNNNLTRITDTTHRITVAGTNTKIHENTGYITENTVQATITASATSVIVNHSCDFIPSAKDVFLTLTNLPTNAIGEIYIDTFTSTQMTVHCRNVPGVSTAIIQCTIRKI